MTTSAAKLGICRRAASVTGYGVIDTLDDNVDVARMVSDHYDAIVEEMLTRGNHRFSKRTAALTALTDIALSPWTTLYGAPEAMLALRFVQDNCGQRLDAEEQDTPQGKAIGVIVDATTTVYAVYTKRVEEDRWPADFAMAVQKRIEAVFLASAERLTESMRVEGGADLKDQRARVRDRSASTPGDPSDWDLTQARRSNQRWSAWRAR